MVPSRVLDAWHEIPMPPERVSIMGGNCAMLAAQRGDGFRPMVAPETQDHEGAVQRENAKSIARENCSPRARSSC